MGAYLEVWANLRIYITDLTSIAGRMFSASRSLSVMSTLKQSMLLVIKASKRWHPLNYFSVIQNFCNPNKVVSRSDPDCKVDCNTKCNGEL